MPHTVSISDDNLQRLQAQADQAGCTVDDLLYRLLSPESGPHRYQQMFNNSHAVQLLIDPDGGHIVEANPAAVGYYGYSIDQLQQMTIHDINTLSRDEVRAEMQRASQQQRVYFEFRHRLANGDVRCVDVYSGPVETAAGTLLYSIIIDASKRKQMEADLRESEQRYRTVADFSTDWTYWQKTDGSLHYVAPSCAQISGYTADELKADPDLIEAMILPEDRHIWDDHAHDQNSSGEARQIHYRIRRKDGNVCWIEHTCRPLYDAHGTFDGYRVSNHDITRRILAQQQEFELALERERVQLLTTFIQNAAHEFRTPLTTISSAAQLMLRIKDPERQTQKAEQIEGQIERITRLIDSLLLMIRLENPASIQQMHANVRHTVQIVCETLYQRYGDHPALHQDIPRDLPLILGHPEYLMYALTQVLDNAYRFTPPDGHITIAAQAEADQILLMINNTGPHIDAAHMPHIFETFWRHDAAHTTPGLGLGLSIARRIIEKHQGTITIHNLPDRGVSCHITLPTAPISPQ